MKPFVFVSYSHKDKKWLEQIQIHLKPLERNGKITLWDDTKIRAGGMWKQAIEGSIEQASAAILLVTADFLASDFIADNELPPLLEAAEERGTTIIPVIVRHCGYSREPKLEHFQSFNDPKTPLAAMSVPTRDEMFEKLVQNVDDSIEKFSSRANFNKTSAAKTCFVNISYGIKNIPHLQAIFNFDEFYYNVVKKIVEEEGLVCIRGDENPSNYPFETERDLVLNAVTSDLMIADVSSHSPDVFYYLALRHGATSKPTIVINSAHMLYPPMCISHVWHIKFSNVEKTEESGVSLLRYAVHDALRSSDISKYSNIVVHIVMEEVVGKHI